VFSDFFEYSLSRSNQIRHLGQWPFPVLEIYSCQRVATYSDWIPVSSLRPGMLLPKGLTTDSRLCSWSPASGSDLTYNVVHPLGRSAFDRRLPGELRTRECSAQPDSLPGTFSKVIFVSSGYPDLTVPEFALRYRTDPRTTPKSHSNDRRLGQPMHRVSA
jgi:hypothetical protein